MSTTSIPSIPSQETLNQSIYEDANELSLINSDTTNHNPINETIQSVCCLKGPTVYL